MRFVRESLGLLAFSFSSLSVAADLQSGAPITIELASLTPSPRVTWRNQEQSRNPAQLVEASWSRSIMPNLAEKIAEDGTHFVQLPVVRVYDSKGRRLKVRADVTDPQLAARRLNEAIARNEIDEQAAEFGDALDQLALRTPVPDGQVYVVDYGAAWCPGSQPMHTALQDWQQRSAANGVVLIQAVADFGTRR